MIQEIGPVFKYTRFRLLSYKTMLLTQGQKKTMPLPEARHLSITPRGMKHNRIRYHLRVGTMDSPIFETDAGLIINITLDYNLSLWKSSLIHFL